MKRQGIKFAGMVLILAVSLIFATAIPKAFAAAEEPTEFTFNRNAAIKHAQAALDDFFALSMPQVSLEEYQTQSPKVAGIISKGCDGKDRNLILVAFPSKQKEGWADVRLIRNKDGLITEIVGMGVSIHSWDEMLRNARKGAMYCE